MIIPREEKRVKYFEIQTKLLSLKIESKLSLTTTWYFLCKNENIDSDLK